MVGEKSAICIAARPGNCYRSRVASAPVYYGLYSLIISHRDGKCPLPSCVTFINVILILNLLRKPLQVKQIVMNEVVSLT